MKFFALLACAFLSLASAAHASTSPFEDPVGENDQSFCESYEPGCERSTQDEWEEPARPNYPENPDDPYLPNDL